VDYLFSENGGHGFSDALTEQSVYIAIERFLAPVLGGLSQEATPAEIEICIARLREAGKRVH
jgi:hypothetical protein